MKKGALGRGGRHLLDDAGQALAETGAAIRCSETWAIIPYKKVVVKVHLGNRFAVAPSKQILEARSRVGNTQSLI